MKLLLLASLILLGSCSMYRYQSLHEKYAIVCDWQYGMFRSRTTIDDFDTNPGENYYTVRIKNDLYDAPKSRCDIVTTRRYYRDRY